MFIGKYKWNLELQVQMKKMLDFLRCPGLDQHFGRRGCAFYGRDNDCVHLCSRKTGNAKALHSLTMPDTVSVLLNEWREGGSVSRAYLALLHKWEKTLINRQLHAW